MRKGKLIVCRIHDIDQHRSDINLLIVRKLLYKVKGAEHFPYLAPKDHLFHSMISAKKFGDIDKLKQNLKQFELEIAKPEYRSIIGLITDDILDKGYNVTLACYCENKNLCHRKSIAKEFEKLGYRVEIY